MASTKNYVDNKIITTSQISPGSNSSILVTNSTGVTTWTSQITNAQIVPSTANTVLLNNNTGSSTNWSLINDANISSSAAININKLSTSGATTNQVIQYNGTTPIWNTISSSTPRSNWLCATGYSNSTGLNWTQKYTGGSGISVSSYTITITNNSKVYKVSVSGNDSDTYVQPRYIYIYNFSGTGAIGPTGSLSSSYNVSYGGCCSAFDFIQSATSGNTTFIIQFYTGSGGDTQITYASLFIEELS
jgi:hypothetical protein